jgi:hypothetical protein
MTGNGYSGSCACLMSVCLVKPKLTAGYQGAVTAVKRPSRRAGRPRDLREGLVSSR